MFPPMTQQTERARIANENREMEAKAALMVRTDQTQPLNLVNDLRRMLGGLNTNTKTLKPQTAQGK